MMKDTQKVATGSGKRGLSSENLATALGKRPTGSSDTQDSGKSSEVPSNGSSSNES